MTMGGLPRKICCVCVSIAVLSGAYAFAPVPKRGLQSVGRSVFVSVYWRGIDNLTSRGRTSSAVSKSRSVDVHGQSKGKGGMRTGPVLDVLRAQMTDEEMALDQALIARVAREVEEESGVDLEQLINPAKVINLERDLVKLRATLASGQDSDRSAIEEEIAKKESTLAIEKRSVMQGWLKKIFVGQAIISTILGGFMAYDAVPFFPDVDLSIRVLGFWFVWLFTVPSLRARKPGEAEKVALNIAFLATPLVSFAMPFITKDPVPIYWANLVTLSACYGYGFTIGRPDRGQNTSEANQPKWLKFVYKSLDFGSGQERGVRGAARDRLFGNDSEEDGGSGS